MDKESDKIDSLENEMSRFNQSIENNNKELIRFIDKGLKILTRNIKNMESNSYNQIVSYLDLRQRVGHDKVLPRLRGHAISPDTAIFLDDLLKQYRPLRILELGSGFSSAIIALHCLEHGGRVTSVDHIEEFGWIARNRVEAWGAGATFDLVVADLVEQDTPIGKRRFYDLKPVSESGSGYDFVFLDGPPKYVEAGIRANFLPLFAPLLAEGCIVLLDDYYRSGEQEAVAGWVEAGLVEVLVENKDVEKHAAVLRFTRNQG